MISVLKGGAFVRYRVGDVYRCVGLENQEDETLRVQVSVPMQLGSVPANNSMGRIPHIRSKSSGLFCIFMWKCPRNPW